MQKKEITDKEKRKTIKVQEKTKGIKIDLAIKSDREMLAELKPITDKEIEQQLTAIAFGLVKDRFGFEITAQEKIKALQSLAKIRGLDSSSLNINASVKTDKIESIAFALGLNNEINKDEEVEEND